MSAPISASRVAAWDRECRTPRWQQLVRRLHGADAVDNFALSVADCERLATAAMDELRLPSTELPARAEWRRLELKAGDLVEWTDQRSGTDLRGRIGRLEIHSPSLDLVAYLRGEDGRTYCVEADCLRGAT